MANTTSPSTAIGPSSKLGLPTEDSIVLEEGKANNGFQEFSMKVDTPPSNFQKIVAELIGTYFLIFLGCGAALVNKVEPLTILGIAIVWGLVPMYVVSQLLGATLASLTLRVLFSDQDNLRSIMTHYSSPTTDLEAITWEFIISFLLMFTICGVATDHRASKDISGLAVGAVLLVNVMVAGPITGASMNPARSFGPAIVLGIYTKIWVFILAPVLGAMAATLVYRILRVIKPEKSESTKSIYNHLYLKAEP
ncbi:Major intrinsic protein [Trema orientale]|uniref:Major intrinsic protein n=1 Tax=Trema orientale TaxID=63057 RepID=A0A2P5G1N9_TREOI|nr:Major intrinsic protein [Trema orientale]